MAADDVKLRVATHDGFVRLAFDWPSPVHYEAHSDGGQLLIHFDRPVTASLGGMTDSLKTLASAVKKSEDGTTVIADLRAPVTVKSFVLHGTTIVVDVSPAPPASPTPKAPSPESATSKAPSPESATSKAPSPATAAPKPLSAAKAPTHLAPTPTPRPSAIGVKVEDAKGMKRIVFAWPHRVDYDFHGAADSARLGFKSVVSIDLGPLAAALPQLAPKIESDHGRTIVVIALPKGVDAKPVRTGNDVVLEVTGIAAAAPPNPEPPAAATSSPPQNSADAPSPPVVTGPVPVTLPVHYLTDGDTTSLRFDWPITTPAAVFRRGSAIWIAFPVPTKLDLTEVRNRGQQFFSTIEQPADGTATLVRLVAHDGVNPRVRRAGTAWIIDFKVQPAQTDGPVIIDVRPSATPPQVLFRIRDPGTPVRIRDPDAGDSLIVVAAGDVGRGVGAQQGFVDFRALPTLQGVVLRPNADDINVATANDLITVTRPGGLALSNERDRMFGRTDPGRRLFDFVAWQGTDEFLKRRSLLEQSIAAAPTGARSKPRLDLARFYVAELMGAEASGVLEAIAHDDPETAADPGVRALRGAACLLGEDLTCANDELSLHVFDHEPEAILWRGSLAAEMGDWPNAADDFVQSVSLLPSYPKGLRNRFFLQAAEALLNTDQASAATPLLDLVLTKSPSPSEKAMAAYLKGRLEQQTGQLDRALETWQQVADMGDRPSRAKALYSSALAKMDAGKATRDETIKALDALSFAWRGDTFEFQLMRRLGELRLAAGDYHGGIAALQDAVTNFPDNPVSKDISKEITETLTDALIGKHADDLSPLTALALYDEFKSALPANDASDTITRKLADRLVSVDLLDRAATLLDDQVAHRLSGRDKARVATQVALLRLLDHNPDAALKALDVDIGHDVPPELGRQRQQLRARALLDLDKPQDALSILMPDTSRDADRLRADIYWRAQNWKEASKVFARLVPPLGPDGKLDEESVRLIMSWAAALTLDSDQAGLAKLRDTYGKAMADTPSAGLFHIIADDAAPSAKDADPRDIAAQVAQLGDLQNFIASYRQKLASDRLSTIN